MTRIGYNQLSFRALARIGLICNAGLWVPLGLVLGVAALFGLTTVRFNNAPVHGPGALLVALLLSVVFVLVGTIALMTGAIMARLARPLLRRQMLSLKSADEPATR